MKPSIQWCRSCVAAHAPGEHLRYKNVSVVEQVDTSDLKSAGEIRPSSNLGAYTKPKHNPQPVDQPKAAPCPASEGSNAMPARQSNSTPPKKVPSATRAAPATASRTSAGTARAGTLAGAKRPKSAKPSGKPKRSKPLEDATAELARRRALKAAQQKRFRDKVKAKRLAAQ